MLWCSFSLATSSDIPFPRVTIARFIEGRLRKRRDRSDLITWDLDEFMVNDLFSNGPNVRRKNGHGPVWLWLLMDLGI